MYKLLYKLHKEDGIMKKGTRINALVLIVAMVCGCLIGAQVSMAATYPDHPVKLMVGFPPGGPASTVATLIAKRASEFMEQPMTVEHKPGGGATLAATTVAKAKPDGYNVFMGSDSPLLIAPLITKDLSYTLEDFIPIVGYGFAPTFISCKKGRWNSLKEFIADAKKNPGKYTYATQSVNSFNHFAVKLLEEQAGIELKMVPFPGNAEALTALLGGHIDLVCVAGTSGLYEAGRIEALAIAEKKRLKDYGKIPTLDELGYPIFMNSYYFLCAPKGTPQEIINKLTDVNQKVFAKYGGEIETLLNKFEMLSSFLSADEVAKQNNYRRDIFRKITKSMGIYVPNR
jgi:tripartite-type tricarboxylate transporter receptor subunit TctC